MVERRAPNALVEVPAEVVATGGRKGRLQLGELGRRDPTLSEDLWPFRRKIGK
jgi:hypothetical protein